MTEELVALGLMTSCIALVMLWLIGPSLPWRNPVQFQPEHLIDSLWPGFTADNRKFVPFAAVSCACSAYVLVAALSGSHSGGVVVGILAALDGPRVLGSVTRKRTDETPVARAVVEAMETAAASGYTAVDGLEALRVVEGDAGAIAAEVLIDIGHHVSPAEAIARAGQRRGPILRRTLRLLAVFVSRGHWGGEATTSLRQIRDTIEKQRRLGNTIRMATSDVRSLRMAILIVVPAMALLLFTANRQVMIGYIQQPLGQISLLLCALLYGATVVLSRWLIPDWGE